MSFFGPAIQAWRLQRQLNKQESQKLQQEMDTLQSLQNQLFRDAQGDTSDPEYQAALARLTIATGLSETAVTRWAVIEMAKRFKTEK